MTVMNSDQLYLEAKKRIKDLKGFYTHVFATFIILPFLIRGCETDFYKIPKGEVAQQQVVKIKKIKKIEQLVFNPNSAISYYVPELNKKVVEELDRLPRQ